MTAEDAAGEGTRHDKPGKGGAFQGPVTTTVGNGELLEVGGKREEKNLSEKQHKGYRIFKSRRRTQWVLTGRHFSWNAATGPGKGECQSITSKGDEPYGRRMKSARREAGS